MLKITSIEGNRQWLDGGSMFGNAPRAVWQKWTEVDEQGRIPLACRCLLIETENLKVLCEAGIGAFFEPKLAQRFGVQEPSKHLLLENLKSAGYDPDSIDYVILSHLHFDHAGGLLPRFEDQQRGETDLVFKNAKFVVGQKAWERAQKPHYRDKASFLPDLNKKLEVSGRLILVDSKPPEELEGFMDFFESHGHTPGQMHSLIKSGDKTIVFAGDLIPGVPWVHLPITMGYDRYPERLIEEKSQLYERFSGQDFSIFFTHDAQFAMGQLEKNEKGRYQVTNMSRELQGFSF